MKTFIKLCCILLVTNGIQSKAEIESSSDANSDTQTYFQQTQNYEAQQRGRQRGHQPRRQVRPRREPRYEFRHERSIYPGSGWQRNPWDHRPGWRHDWQWNKRSRPHWLEFGFTFPAFWWINEVRPGYWQCTAFDSYHYAFSAVGRRQNEAAYNALYDCGGPFNYNNNECYIPNGYCRYYR